jgi:hypothetical protein
MKQKHAPHHGEVTSIGDHHGGSGKFAVVHVAHGPRPKPPKPKKGSAGGATTTTIGRSRRS